MDNIFKSIIAAAGAAISYLFGGWSALMGILLAFVVADYVTGIVAAYLEGKLASDIGLRGIAKKVFVFGIVAIAHLIDTAIGAGSVFRDATIFFYLANEVLSILENAGKIGVPIPPIISKGIEILKSKSEVKE
jgi:toxin secretion/phage lysis holin